MRPPEIDVTLAIYQLECTSTEDSGGDEPYMWILGFKVDAETMVDVPASFIPSLGVKIVEGVPASPFIKGTGEVNAGEKPAVPAALGTRWMRLKPALLKNGDWFPGAAFRACAVDATERSRQRRLRRRAFKGCERQRHWQPAGRQDL